MFRINGPLEKAAKDGLQDNLVDLLKGGGEILDNDDLHYALLAASKRGHARCIDLLVGAGADVNRKYDADFTAIMHAAMGGHEDCIDVLIKSGADVSSLSSFTWWPASYSVWADREYLSTLSLALSSGSTCIGTVRKILNAGADLSGLHGGYALAKAVTFHERPLEVVRLLLEAGAQDFQNIAMKIAAATNSKTCIELLHNAGSNVNVGTLIYAIRNSSQNLQSVKYLVELGAQVNVVNFDDSPLCAAVDEDRVDVLEFLIESGADVNVVLGNGSNALIHAVDEGQQALCRAKELRSMGISRYSMGPNCMSFKYVEIFMHGGANPHITGPALFKAIACCDDKMVNFLIKKGADVNNAVGDSPLSAALHGKRFLCAKDLVKAGADVNDKRDDCTPLMTAVKLKFEKIIPCLLKAGADVNFRDESNKTALIYAAEKGFTGILKTLIKIEKKQTSNSMSEALVEATIMKRLACVNHLVRAGADVNKPERTPLMVAAKNGCYRCLDTLMKSGADVNKRDPSSGLSALMFSSHCTSKVGLLCVKRLLRKGAHVNIFEQSRNQNALQIFVLKCWQETERSKILYASGEKLNVVPNFLKHTDLQFNLMHLCRQAIRNHLLDLDPHENLFARIPKLEGAQVWKCPWRFPSLLVKYLLYDQSLEIDEEEVDAIDPLDSHEHEETEHEENLDKIRCKFLNIFRGYKLEERSKTELDGI